MEGNIGSLSQHDYYGNLLHNYTYTASIELLAFSVGMGVEGGRERSENSKVLKKNVKNCFYMQLGNKKYR